jgi:RNA polymerase sigma-70 factor (ECF subfamily)
VDRANAGARVSAAVSVAPAPASETRLRAATTPPTDQELMRLAVAGDRAAFGEIVRRHRRVAFGVAMKRLGSEADADDVVQHVFLHLFTAMPSPEDVPRFSLRGYVCTAVRGGCADGRWRGPGSMSKLARTSVPLNDELTEEIKTEGTPALAFEQCEERAARQRQIDALPPDVRRTLLFLLEGRTQREAAAMLGLNHKVVRNHVLLATMRLGTEAARNEAQAARLRLAAERREGMAKAKSRDRQRAAREAA